jgi:hypothetical protein
MERDVHKRYLTYRDLHVYFGGKKAIVSAAEFEALDAEFTALDAKGDARDDEEEARWTELGTLLHRD